MAEELVQINDLPERTTTVTDDLFHFKANDDDNDYKITLANLASSLRDDLSLGDLAYQNTINNSVWLGADLALVNGGTGASSASSARTNLEVYSKVESNSTFLTKVSNLADLPSKATARTNLGLGSLSTLNQTERSIVAGNGLIGGGTFEDSRTINLGTPETVTASTNNTSSANSHTHKVDDSLIIPVGGIIMWSGSIASIPTGWRLCDGTGGTPNLRDRFVVGAGSGYSVGDTGGAATINHAHSGTVSGHALTEPQMPKHYHRMKGPNSGAVPQGGASGYSVYGGGTPDDGGWLYGTYSVGGGAASNSTSTGTGSGQQHNHGLSIYSEAIDNRPPFYALAYIQKV